MKVNSSSQGSAEKTRGARETESTKATESKGKRKSSKTESVETGVSDKVSISGRAKDAAYAKEVATKASDVNDEKVARLKEQIRNGTYKVDADKIADRLVDEHLMTAF